MDAIYNHLGYPAGDMWQFDGWSQNGKGGIYFYNDWRGAQACEQNCWGPSSDLVHLCCSMREEAELFSFRI
jgi:hypothetical protein